MKKLRSDRDWVLCPTVIRAPLTTGVGVRFLTTCGIELAIHHAARHARFFLNRAWGRRLQSRMGRGFQPQYMLHIQMPFDFSCLNRAWLYALTMLRDRAFQQEALCLLPRSEI